jgi:hypothetical protein
MIRPDQQLRDTRLQSGPRWLPWIVILSTLLFFGADFIFRGKVFLAMDFLQVRRPWDLLFQQKTPINNVVISDIVEGLYPYLSFFSQELKMGHIPLWNPNIFLGLPSAMIGLTNFVMNPLYLVLFWAFSPATAHSLTLLIDLTLVATFSYLFFRQRGLSDLSALFGSLVLTFNGVTMVWLEFMSADFSYAGTAASLYLFEKSLAEPRMRFLLLNGITLGILLLGGSVQWVFFLVPLLGLYALFRTIELWNERQCITGRTSPLRHYLVALSIGTLIALPTLLHFLEYMGLSHRTKTTFEVMQAKMGTFYPELVGTFLFPNLFGYHPSGVYFARGSSAGGYQNYNEMMVYMGVATLVLAALAYRLKTYRMMALGWSSVIVLALVVAMKLPFVYYLMYHYIPGFNGMQPSRIFIILPPAFAFLSALGMEGLIRRPPDRREAVVAWRWILGLALILTLVLIGTHAYFVRYPQVVNGVSLAAHFRLDNTDFLYPLALLIVIGAGLVLYAARKISVRWLCLVFIVAIVVDLVPFGLRVNTRTERSMIFPKTNGLNYLTQDHELFRVFPIGFQYNTLMPFNIETIGGYASMFPASYLELLSAMEAHERPGAKLGQEHQNYIAPKAVTSRLLPMLNVKYLVIPNNADLRGDLRTHYSLRHRSDLAVFQAVRYLPRVYAVYRYHQTGSRSETIDYLLRDEFDPSIMAVGEKPLPSLELAAPDGPPAVTPPVTVARPNSDRFELDVRMVLPGIVVVSEQFFPGWEAQLDGRPAEVFPVNGALMGIAVPGGDHRVSLRFLPRAIKVGLPVTVFVGMLCVALLFFDWARHAPRKGVPKDRDPQSQGR